MFISMPANYSTRPWEGFLPKVEISLWVDDDQAESVAERIARVARTGRIGDGKIFVVPLALPQLEF